MGAPCRSAVAVPSGSPFLTFTVAGIHSHGADAELEPPLMSRAQRPTGPIGHPESHPLRLPLAQLLSQPLPRGLQCPCPGRDRGAGIPGAF
ncbi:hypothetical protein QTO34_006683 [Cnephaeus nilssonii]|uniref:Uncharacterized protein n=1 Tax=Cnephaeus nilssonii TaxID=3371016 RepID=A0AA40HKZ1_CNENI|nr:hypothetical protein QTO34_006683 [Eptesicus nilssonii]